MSVEELKKEFGELIPLLQEINALNHSIEKRHNEQVILYQNKDKSNVQDKKKGLIIGEVLVGLWVIGMVFFFSLFFLEVLFDFALIFILLFSVLYPIVIVKVNKILLKKIKEEDENRRKKLNEEFESKEIALNRKREYRAELINTVASRISVVPVNYQYLMAIEYMYSYFCNGRADTLKEAVNLYEEELFRMRQEQRSEQLVELQAQQAYSLSRVQQAATVTAVATSVNTISNIVKR